MSELSGEVISMLGEVSGVEALHLCDCMKQFLQGKRALPRTLTDSQRTLVLSVLERLRVHCRFKDEMLAVVGEVTGAIELCYRVIPLPRLMELGQCYQSLSFLFEGVVNFH